MLQIKLKNILKIILLNKGNSMKLITNDVIKQAQIHAIKNRADDIEKRVVKKLQNSLLQPNIEEKLIALLENKPNIELSQSSIIRNVQSVVNTAFKNKNDHKVFTKNVNEAIELLALSLVVADDDLITQNG